MQKKGAELSLTVVIVAILALLVLVVLATVFLGRMNLTQQGISDCTSKQGICAPVCGSEEFGTQDMGFTLPVAVAKCPDDNGEPQKCCTKTIITG